MKIRSAEVFDVRFPTSRSLDGSDAMNPDPDYSAAYVVLKTDTDELSGSGMTFTIGRGNELCVAGIRSLLPLLIGCDTETLMKEPVELARRLNSDSQLRWVGPDKGVLHLATAALVNAVWDLYARSRQKPLWQLLADMPSEQLVHCVDFRYLSDALTPGQATELLRSVADGESERRDVLRQSGYPSYTTSAGWLGYSDEELSRRCRDLTKRGWSHFKIKVGRDREDDHRRCRLLRSEIGETARLMIDANQVWDVPTAIEWIRDLAPYSPWFVEEPTHPDDILGHAAISKAVAPIRIATGEMCHNRMMFKQFLSAGGMQVCQLDTCRLAGVNEVLAVLLLARRYNVPVCPHAGGVGLCEYVQHISMLDYLRISATTEDRVAEYSDHLHEHLEDPVRMKDGCYMPPENPGYSVRFLPEALNQFAL